MKIKFDTVRPVLRNQAAKLYGKFSSGRSLELKDAVNMVNDDAEKVVMAQTALPTVQNQFVQEMVKSALKMTSYGTHTVKIETAFDPKTDFRTLFKDFITHNAKYGVPMETQTALN